jgi:lipoate-protein ligase A
MESRQSRSVTPLTVYISESFDPMLNLALEEWIYARSGGNAKQLYLWRNRDSVIIGRFQNPWTECRVGELERDGVQLARRRSGGGAVYHDTGNTNFTFFTSRQDYSKERNFEIVLRALNGIGIPAAASGRHDLIAEGRKISGSAFKLTSERAYHHGTLLLNSNLEKLVYYLTPDDLELESKGIASVRSRVANLTEFDPVITHEQLAEELIGQFESYYGGKAEVMRLDPKRMLDDPEFRESYRELASWEWLWGRTPKFTRRLSCRFDWGEMELLLTAKRGTIEAVTLPPDGLPAGRGQDMAATIEGVLKGCRYSREAVADLLDRNRTDRRLAEFLRWFIEQI